MALEKRFSTMEKSYNSLQSEVAAIKLLVGGINNRTKGNGGSSTPKVTESSRHKTTQLSLFIPNMTLLNGHPLKGVVVCLVQVLAEI